MHVIDSTHGLGQHGHKQMGTGALLSHYLLVFSLQSPEHLIYLVPILLLSFLPTTP